MEVNTI